MYRELPFIFKVAGYLSLFAAASACNFVLPHVDTDDMFNEQEYRRQLDEALDLNAAGETVIRGKVSDSLIGCERGEEYCHFILDANAVSISIYYSYGPKLGGCVNSNANEVGAQVTNGDEVEVFGDYYELGSISVCDSSKYYIRFLE